MRNSSDEMQKWLREPFRGIETARETVDSVSLFIHIDLTGKAVNPLWH